MFARGLTKCLVKRGSDQERFAFANLLDPRCGRLELQEIGKLEGIKGRSVAFLGRTVSHSALYAPSCNHVRGKINQVVSEHSKQSVSVLQAPPFHVMETTIFQAKSGTSASNTSL